MCGPVDGGVYVTGVDADEFENVDAFRGAEETDESVLIVDDEVAGDL